MFKNFKLLPFLVLPLLSACRKRVHITTNTFADVQAIPGGFEEGSSFAVIPASKENQLFNKEISHKIARELQTEGYQVKPAKEAAKADYCLVFGYGITSSTNTVNVAKYIPGERQVKQGFIAGRRDVVDYEEVTETSGTTVYVPEEYTVFKRELMMQVYDAKLYHKDKQEELVWQGTAVSVGDCSDLRLIIDYLIGALFNHFGESTGMNLHSSVDLGFDGIGQNF
jgi:hypothetical protein